MQHWLDAAKQFDDTRDSDRVTAQSQEEVATYLEEFLRSQNGKNALVLLRSAQTVIRFGAESGDHVDTCWVLWAEGFAKQTEREADVPVTREQASISDVAAAWLDPKKTYRQLGGGQIAQWLEREIDMVASLAP